MPTARTLVLAALGVSACVACANGGPASAAEAPSTDAAPPRGGESPDGRCVVTLAEAPSPGNLIVSGGRVFFTSCGSGVGSVLSVSTDGGTVSTLATGSCPTGLALSGSSLYAAGLDPAGLTALDAAGNGPRPFVSVGEPVQSLAADLDAVYFATASALSKAPLDGSPVTALAADHSSWTNLVVSGGRIFFGDRPRGTVHSIATSGGAETLVASGADGVSAIAVDGAFVYVATGYTVGVAPSMGGSVAFVGTAAGAEVLAITADTAGVYYSSVDAVWKVPPSGGAPTALAGSENTVTALVTDPEALYFANSRPCCGSVRRILPK